MPKYKYVAVNLEKKKYKGVFIAEDEKDLAIQLTKQNLYLVSAVPYKGSTPSAFFTLGTGKVKITELSVFCRQFAIMLSTGVTLMDAIDNLRHQPFSAYFKSILQVVAEDISAGLMLSEAFDKHKKIFPHFFCSMVHVGEESGKLDRVFLSLADYYESDASIKRKVKSALSYPMMLAGLTLGIVVLMMLFVVPTFRSSLSSLDVEITGLTKIVYDISDFVLLYWSMMLAGAIVVVGGMYLFFRTKKGKRILDVMTFKMPVIGRIQSDLITARFARAFGILLSSGIDLATALEKTSIILGNTYVKERFVAATEDVYSGVSLTVALENQKIFPRMLLQMISIGEKTASLEEVLGRSCKFFDEQVEISLNSMTSKIQPIMLLILAVIVGTLFFAVYSPMLAIMSTLSALG